VRAVALDESLSRLDDVDAFEVFRLEFRIDGIEIGRSMIPPGRLRHGDDVLRTGDPRDIGLRRRDAAFLCHGLDRGQTERLAATERPRIVRSHLSALV